MTNSMIKRNHYFPSIMGRSVLDQFFDQVFDDSLFRRSTEGYPLTDIYKTDEGDQVIEMALAGFSKEDLNIEVKDNSITITCEKTTEGEVSTRKIARRSFTKSFVDYNSELNMKNALASFDNGLLKISIPQIEEAKPTVIDIK